MADGYGSDATATNTDPGTGASIAASLAQIFSTGVTAYVDSQAIQNGYSINDPRYYQSGYPGGVSTPYGPTFSGQPVSAVANSSNSGLLLIGLIVVGAVLLLRH